MGLRPKNDPGDIWIFTTVRRTALVLPLLRILALRRLLLPLFLERLLAYTLRLCRSGSICHPLYFKASRQLRVPQPRFTLTIAGSFCKSGVESLIRHDFSVNRRNRRSHSWMSRALRTVTRSNNHLR